MTKKVILKCEGAPVTKIRDIFHSVSAEDVLGQETQTSCTDQSLAKLRSPRYWTSTKLDGRRTSSAASTRFGPQPSELNSTERENAHLRERITELMAEVSELRDIIARHVP